MVPDTTTSTHIKLTEHTKLMRYQSDKVNSIIMSCITYTTMAHVHDDTKVWGSFVKLAKQTNNFCHLIESEYAVSLRLIGHVNRIPTMQFFTGISRNTQ